MVDVAPFTGAWIETIRRDKRRHRPSVAPFTGAWIETRDALTTAADFESRSLHGSVD